MMQIKLLRRLSKARYRSVCKLFPNHYQNTFNTSKHQFLAHIAYAKGPPPNFRVLQHNNVYHRSRRACVVVSVGYKLAAKRPQN